MSLSSRNDTATMARLFADQGYLRKAAQIYRHLLKQTPDSDDLRQALADVEHRIKQQGKPSMRELGLLLREWKDLIGEYNKRRN